MKTIMKNGCLTTRVAVAIAITTAATACAIFPRPEPELPGEPEPVVATTEPAPTPRPPGPAQPPGFERECWPGLFLSEDDLSPAERAESVGDLAVSRREFDHWLRESADSGQARLKLREDLMLLWHLENSDLKDDRAFQADARAELRRHLAKMVIEQSLAAADVVTEREIQARYERDAASYTIPARVSIRLILVQTRAEADEVLSRLDDGEEFAEVAAEVSTHPSSAEGGRIDPFSRGTWNSQMLEDLAFSLKPGETGSVEAPQGYFVIKKVADSEQSMVPLDQVRGTIEQTLREEKRARARQQLLRDIERRINEAESGGAG